MAKVGQNGIPLLGDYLALHIASWLHMKRCQNVPNSPSRSVKGADGKGRINVGGRDKRGNYCSMYNTLLAKLVK